MGLRATYTGMLQFSLVMFPIKVYSATESENPFSMNQLHRGGPLKDKDGNVLLDENNEVRMKTCGCRINMIKNCPACGLVPDDEIEKGYEYEPGKFVTVTADELKAIQVESTKVISITDVLEHIEPGRLNKPYFIAPDMKKADVGGAAKTYLTFVEGLGTGWAIGKMATRGKEYTVGMHVQDGILMLYTLHDSKMVRKASDVDILQQMSAVKTAPAEVGMVQQILGTMRRPNVNWADYKDGYEVGKERIIKAKIAGDEIVVETEPDVKPSTTDLMAALAASLETVKTAGPAKPKDAKVTTRKRKTAAA